MTILEVLFLFSNIERKILDKATINECLLFDIQNIGTAKKIKPVTKIFQKFVWKNVDTMMGAFDFHKNLMKLSPT